MAKQVITLAPTEEVEAVPLQPNTELPTTSGNIFVAFVGPMRTKLKLSTKNMEWWQRSFSPFV